MKMMSESHISPSTPPLFLILPRFTHISTFSFQKVCSDFFISKKSTTCLCSDDEKSGKEETRTKVEFYFIFSFFGILT